MTRCAVRALDLRGGRLCGVVTERGRVAADAVVLAGGAWSRLFSGNAGIDLPQLKVLNSVLRTTPVEGGPDASLWTDAFALRKRADGGYTLASGHLNTHDLVPDSLTLARAFWPALRADWRSLRFRLSDRARIEAGYPRRWSSGDVTPFETCRTLDPAPQPHLLNRVWAAARAAFPMFESAQVAQSWGGMIDVTPDAIPVISQIDAIPGFFIATGFSGHGFGIGPGAGRLVADLVTGRAPVVDPAPYRFSRFTDGSRIHLDAGF
jgi:glycine/D-amino acid oxidase-like deaminating enzyme